MRRYSAGLARRYALNAVFEKRRYRRNDIVIPAIRYTFRLTPTLARQSESTCAMTKGFHNRIDFGGRCLQSLCSAS